MAEKIIYMAAIAKFDNKTNLHCLVKKAVDQAKLLSDPIAVQIREETRNHLKKSSRELKQ